MIVPYLEQMTQRMTSIDTTRADKYEASARAAMAEGFANETRRKQDGLELVSRAYQALREIVNAAVWSVVCEQEKEQKARYWELGLPLDLHNLSGKHTAYVMENAPVVEELLTKISGLFELRNQIKAMALLPRKTPKREQVPQEGDKTQQRGHCQCCAREHAVSGFVAQHGYKVKHGFFNGVCPGHQYQPMEQDRTVTDQTAKAMRAKAAVLDMDAERVKAGELKPSKIPNAAHHGAELVPFAEAAPHWQESALKSMQHGLEQQARAFRSMADTLQAIADKYHGQPLRVVKV